jgi:hypothetical protein
MPRRKAHAHIVDGLRNRLRAALESRGWSVADLRERLRGKGVLVAASTPHDWVTKGVVPDAYVLLVTCDLLGVRYRWALTGEGPMAMDGSETKGGAGGDQLRVAELAVLDRIVGLVDQERARLTGRDPAVGAAGRAIASALPGAGGARRRRPASGE